MTTARIRVCVFQNRETKKYRWLSFESTGDGRGRCLCESSADTVDLPSQRPSDEVSKPGSLPDYEERRDRISEDGYDIVTQQ